MALKTKLTQNEIQERALVVAFNAIRTAAVGVATSVETNRRLWHEDTIAVNDRAVQLLEDLATDAAVEAGRMRPIQETEGAAPVSTADL
jgi:hypothetical protein